MITEMKSVPISMIKDAKRLKEGSLLIVYRDGNNVRCETEHGEDPYVWRKGQWRPMKR